MPTIQTPSGASFFELGMFFLWNKITGTGKGLTFGYSKIRMAGEWSQALPVLRFEVKASALLLCLVVILGVAVGAVI